MRSDTPPASPRVTRAGLDALAEWARADVRAHLIALGTLSRPLRTLILGTAGLLVIAAALVATRDLPQPQLTSAAGIIPVIAFVMTALLLALALSSLVTGALIGHWLARWGMLAVVSGMLLFDSTYVPRILADPLVLIVPPVLVTVLALGLLLAGLWGTGLYVSLRHASAAQDAVMRQRPSPGIFALILTLTTGYFAVDWWSGVAIGIPETFPLELKLYVGTLALLLVPTLLVGGSEYADLSTTAVTRLAVEARRLRWTWALPAVCAVVAVAILATVPRESTNPRALWGPVAMAALGAGLLLVVVRVAWAARGAPAEIPPWAPLAGLAALVLALTGTVIAGSIATPGDQRSAAAHLAAVALMIGPLLLSLVLGVWLMARDAGGLYLALVTLTVLLVTGADIAAEASLPVPLPRLTLAVMQVVVALGTLGALGWALVRRRPLEPLAVALLALNVGLQVTVWVFHLYSAGGGGLMLFAAGQFTAAQAAAPLLLGVLRLVGSGRFTNVEGRAFTRTSRVVLAAGYALATTTALLYLTTLRADASGAALLSGYESHTWPILGLLLLSLPMLLTKASTQLRWGQRATAGQH